MNFICKKCGSVKVYIEQKGTQVGLYCADCGAWIKWLGKDEKRLAEIQIKKNNELDMNVNKDNKDMEMVNEILDFVIKQEDYYNELGLKEMDRNNAVGHMVMTAQASSFQKVRYLIEDLLDKTK